MIRVGSQYDLDQILAFDVFRGSRFQEIEESRLYVFEDSNSEICGFIAEARDSLCGRPFLSYMVVDPKHRRKGIASQLLEYMEQRHQKKRLFLSTEEDNHAMLLIIKNRNYVEAGRISGANFDGADEIYFYKDIVGLSQHE